MFKNLSFSKRILTAVLLLTTFAAGSLSSANPVPIDISESRGMTCLKWMMKVVKPALDKDEQTTFKAADRATVKAQAAKLFDPSVLQKEARSFKDGENGLNELIQAIEGQEFTPLNFSAAIAKKLEDLKLVDPSKVGLDAVTVAPFLGIVSGAGVRILWFEGSESTQSIEYGYKKGETTDKDELAKAVKSGRGFGISGDRKALDASDVFYLKGLDSYLAKNKDSSSFFQLLIDVLTQCDTSKYKSLDADGRAVATDFFTVYVAEQTRHLMAELKSHPWENDLAEVTMLSAFVSESKQVYKGGKRKLVDGTPVDFFGKGATGSGIGDTRKDRRALQADVTKAARAVAAQKNKPELVSDLENIIGKSDDVFKGLMDFINDPKNEKEVEKNSAEINKAVTNFLTFIRESASAISKEIQDPQGK